MTNFPETQLSLILRLPSSTDQAAWREFAEIYEPFIYRFARRRGLQHSDAQELVQQVMMAVARSVARWQAGDGQPKFRNWLFTIARNQLINFLKSRKPDAGLGGTTQLTHLQQSVDARSLDDPAGDDDYRYEVFLWAASQVKAQIAETTWLAFWKTAVEDLTCAEAARDLQISVGSVYAARSRVLTRLKLEIQRMHLDDDPARAGGAPS